MRIGLKEMRYLRWLILAVVVSVLFTGSLGAEDVASIWDDFENKENWKIYKTAIEFRIVEDNPYTGKTCGEITFQIPAVEDEPFLRVVKSG